MTSLDTAPTRGADLNFLSRRFGYATVAAIAIVVAGDILLFSHEPGISLVAFFVVIAVATVLVHLGRLEVRSASVGAVACALSLLPMVEGLGGWPFLSGIFGLTILALAAGRRLPRHAIDLPGVLVRFGVLAPVRLMGDGMRLLLEGAMVTVGGQLAKGIVMWIVPAVLAVIFLMLFASANPLIENVLRAVNLDAVLTLLDPWRIVLWGLIAWFTWPFLRPRLLRWRTLPEVYGPKLPRRETTLFGAGAILRSLIVFNALFLLQTGLDITYLWGGVQLPDGLTYATYAHRGAYPLIVTALLAAAFVLAAMRRGGPAENSTLIRNLVYLFIAQNIMLVISSIFRLDLYVETYSLTELRIAAGIWMGLVAMGLLLIMARIAFRKSNKWLISMNLLGLGLTLYATSFLDFSAMIAEYNVDHSLELTGQGTSLDLYYLQRLGPTAIPALDRFTDQLVDKRSQAALEATRVRGELAYYFHYRDRDWRSWSWRDQRLDEYLAARPEPRTVPMSSF